MATSQERGRNESSKREVRIVGVMCWSRPSKCRLEGTRLGQALLGDQQLLCQHRCRGWEVVWCAVWVLFVGFNFLREIGSKMKEREDGKTWWRFQVL